MTDSEIIDLIQQGGIKKERALSLLLQQNWGLIKRGQNRYSLSVDESKEVLLDCIMAFASSVDREIFRRDSKIKTYLYRIFQNRASNKNRDLKRAASKYPFVEEMPIVPDKAKNMLQTMILEEENNWIEIFLEKLGDKCKDILTMQIFGGYSQEEIAQKLNFKTAKSVSTTRYRCLAKLKKLLATDAVLTSKLKGD